MSYTIYGINGPVVSVRGGRGLAMMDMVRVGDMGLIGEVVGVEGDTTTITNTHTPPETPPAHTGSAVQSVAWMAAAICAAALVLLGVVRIARKREGKQ